MFEENTLTKEGNIVFSVSSQKEYESAQKLLLNAGFAWASGDKELHGIPSIEGLIVDSKGVLKYWTDFDSVLSDYRDSHRFYSFSDTGEIKENKILCLKGDWVKELSTGNVYIVEEINTETTEIKVKELRGGGCKFVLFTEVYLMETGDIKRFFSLGDVVKRLYKTCRTSIHSNTKFLVIGLNSKEVELKYFDKEDKEVKIFTVPYKSILKVGSYKDYCESDLSIGSTYFLDGLHDEYSFRKPWELLRITPSKFNGTKKSSYMFYSSESGNRELNDPKNVVCEAKEVSLSEQLLSKSLLIKLFLISKNTKDARLKEIIKITVTKAVNQGYGKNFISNLTINSKGELTHLPKGKEGEGNSEWGSKNRQSGKYGKILRKVFIQLGIKSNEKEIEELVNRLKSHVVDGEFRIIEGEELVSIYTDPNLAPRTGSLSGSCMNEKPSSYFEVYKDNAKMLVLENSAGMLLGRAILWTTTCGIPLMDRIYASDSNILSFLSWAKKEGYWTKERQSYEDPTTFLRPDGEREEKLLTINISKEYDHYPYMDTFKFSDDLDSGEISNDGECGSYVLESTCGGYRDDR